MVKGRAETRQKMLEEMGQVTQRHRKVSDCRIAYDQHACS